MVNNEYHNNENLQSFRFSFIIDRCNVNDHSRYTILTCTRMRLGVDTEYNLLLEHSLFHINVQVIAARRSDIVRGHSVMYSLTDHLLNIGTYSVNVSTRNTYWSQMLATDFN